MSTRGYYGIKKKGELKGSYNHWDSYPSGLGKDLVDELNMYTGGFETSIVTYATMADHKRFMPTFGVSTKALTKNTEKALGFLQEILFESDFSDKKRLNEILLELKSRLEMKFMGVEKSKLLEMIDKIYEKEQEND